MGPLPLIAGPTVTHLLAIRNEEASVIRGERTAALDERHVFLDSVFHSLFHGPSGWHFSRNLDSDALQSITSSSRSSLASSPSSVHQQHDWRYRTSPFAILDIGLRRVRRDSHLARPCPYISSALSPVHDALAPSSRRHTLHD